MEEWRPITGFLRYEISDQGRVRNADTGRILRQTKHPRTGLWMVSLRKEARGFTRNVHRIVAEEFLLPPRQGWVPVHTDGNRDNNFANNLDWKTLSQARELTEQFNRTEPRDYRPVRWIERDWVYPNALEAAREIQGLEKHILWAATSHGSTSYKGGHWEFIG